MTLGLRRGQLVGPSLPGSTGLVLSLQGQGMTTVRPVSCPDSPARAARPPPPPGACGGLGGWPAVGRLQVQPHSRHASNPEVDSCTAALGATNAGPSNPGCHQAQVRQRGAHGREAGPGPPRVRRRVSRGFCFPSGRRGPTGPDCHPVSAALGLTRGSDALATARPAGSTWRAGHPSWGSFRRLIQFLKCPQTPTPCGRNRVIPMLR